jgi:DNA mismatch repair protein MutS
MDEEAVDDGDGGDAGAGDAGESAGRAGDAGAGADPALGPPPEMEPAEELTPMMSQYYELCDRYDDSLVLFQVGDFYEAFCAAAETVSRLCEITLTKREDSTGRYPMAGVPIDSAESYIETLLDAGYRVAVADQVQEPEETTGVVDRAVTRVVTPGTLTEDEFLDEDNNFVACLAGSGPGGASDAGADEDGNADGDWGLAVLDVSTGDFYATGAADLDAIADEVGRFRPSEAVVGPGAPVEPFDPDVMVTRRRPATFEFDRARERVAAYFGRPETLLASAAEIRACGALLAYAEYVRGRPADAAGDPDAAGDADDAGDGAGTDTPRGTGGRLDYLTHLTRYDPREYMLLDAAALRSLELFERRALRGEADATLVGVLDETACALGSRRLADWLRRPLLDRERIDARLDAVGELAHDPATRERLHDALRDVYDIERLVSRIARARANARDLRSLKATLDVVPALREALADADCERLCDLRAALDPCEEVRALIGEAIVAEPPIEVTEGGVIREGYDADLDDLRATEREGKRWIDDLQAGERERTGIDSLKVGYNQVHGYYIEVTDPNLDRVPDDYRRRQTLKNSERYVTPELKEREEEIVTAEERADDLEYELFRAVRSRAAAATERLQALADALATLDALVSLATVAAEHDYCRPTLGADRLAIEAGRHPVVERTRPSFVPNSTDLDRGTLAVITGPNMSGKSTYMRQVALIQVMAQVGSFVPAAAARLPVVDRVFTRVGASDDIAGGRSTFMIEMTEVASVLRGATHESLVLLDEVGRGTSTADGRAIARAVAEHVHDEVGATTLFATHHHDLTRTAERLPRAKNLHFAASAPDEADRGSSPASAPGDAADAGGADADGEAVSFDHRVREGTAGASYGIEVARSAGVPGPVVERARELAAAADEDGDEAGRESERATAPGFRSSDDALDADAVAADGDGLSPAVRARLERVDVATTTPLEALELLSELKGDLE